MVLILSHKQKMVGDLCILLLSGTNLPASSCSLKLVPILLPVRFKFRAYRNYLQMNSVRTYICPSIFTVTSSEQSILHLALANNQTPETLAYLLGQLSSNSEAFSKIWNHKNKSGDTPMKLLMRSSSLGPFLLDTFSPEATCLGYPTNK